MYQHRDWQGALLDFPVNKVVCVGSNYADHIKEMGNSVAPEPVLFIKPETALCDLRQPVAIPKNLGSVHHEVELAVLISARRLNRRMKSAWRVRLPVMVSRWISRCVTFSPTAKRPVALGKRPKDLMALVRFPGLFPSRSLAIRSKRI